MLTALISFIVLAAIGLGLITRPGATLALIALIIAAMIFPLWALAIFAVLAAAFGLLWVKGLPKLEPTDMVDPEGTVEYGDNRRHSKWISHGPANGRRVRRSKTFPGIAKAMAEQWGDFSD